ncbi:transporter substrate-binding domain-containing protein [Telmatospirillum sp.]|uniref:substrate-binding periplasmic protein n=1 Tax=Telmatospirillum sp. TaxID=2079197 RepID=UPI002851B606|nr:transporter substrate-binding domain-containing protein [Telmatospirillum sp.]MDR3439758.1 transporter substrate-binding domain-containing protein [Telmatospirillum sp.]
MLSWLKAVLVCLVTAPLAMTSRVGSAATVVLAAADSRPTAFLVDGRPNGILVDLVTEASRRAGHVANILVMPWARCLAEARTGAIDGVFSSFKLPEREQYLTFSSEVLITQVIALFTLRDRIFSYDGDLAALGVLKIGVISGTSYGTKFDEAVRDGTLRHIEHTNSIEGSLRLLAFGRVDVIPSYRYVALDSAQRMNMTPGIREVAPPLESVPSYLAFTKVRDMRGLSADFDAALASMKRDGTYDRIIASYEPEKDSPPR